MWKRQPIVFCLLLPSLAFKLDAEPAPSPGAGLVKPVVSVSFRLEDKFFRIQFTDRERALLERAVACLFVVELAHDYRFLDFGLAAEYAAGRPTGKTEVRTGQDRNELVEVAPDRTEFHEEIEVRAKAEYCSLAGKPKRNKSYRLRIELRSRKLFRHRNERKVFFRVGIEGTRLRAVPHDADRRVELPFRDAEVWGSKVGDLDTLFTEIESLVQDEPYQEKDFRRLEQKLLSRICLTEDKVKILREPEPAKLAWVVGLYDCDLCLDYHSRLEIEHKTFVDYESRVELEAEYMGRYLDTEDRNWKGKLFLEEVDNTERSVLIVRGIPPKATATGVYVSDYIRRDTLCTNKYQPPRPTGIEFDDAPLAGPCAGRF